MAKYQKLSKSNQTREQEEAAKQWLIDNPPKKSQHFTEGTSIISEGLTVLIVETLHENGDVLLRIRLADGRMSVVKPLALNR